MCPCYASNQAGSQENTSIISNVLILIMILHSPSLSTSNIHILGSILYCTPFQLTFSYVYTFQNKKKTNKGADGHRRQRARLVAAYLQSQSQASSLGQRGQKMHYILVMSIFGKLQSHVTANWGSNSEIWLQNAVD